MGNVGWGEAVFPPYIPESIDSFKAFFSKIELPESLDDLETYLADVHEQFPENPFSIGCLDIALHQLKAQQSGQPLASLFGLPSDNKPSSFTIGISSFEEMKQKIHEASEEEYFKLKVTQKEIGRIIDQYLLITDKPFTIDANQGFTSREEALLWCDRLEGLGVAYVEQPFAKEDFESHRWLKDRSPLPIIADESFQRIGELERIAKCFDGINVKVMKSGGLQEAFHALTQAKQMGLKTLLGCMSESSVGVKSAWALASLADWVDLDGPKLIVNDPFVVEKGLDLDAFRLMD